MPTIINVLFLAAEADPYVKIGGLGDVAGSLPRALRALSEEATGGYKLDVRLVLPLHPVIRSHTENLSSVAAFSLEGLEQPNAVEIFETSLDDMPVYFIDGEPIQAGGSVYSTDATLDGEKYTFFSLAAVELARQLGWRVDVLHANDWHTGLAVYDALLRKWDGEFGDLATMITVHNLPYMGPDVSSLLEKYHRRLVNTGLPDWARTLPMPLGLWAADRIVAVSPNYGKEMLSEVAGCGLDPFLRSRSEYVTGVLNGIDVKSFDPQTDPDIEANFSTETISARFRNKAALQTELDLPADPDIPLLGAVTRMDQQKGIDLAIDALKKLQDESWQAVILGTGDPKIEAAAQRLQEALPDRVRAVLRFDAKLARKIYAGSDIFLMPSRYEPCGLSQMIAMRYGCVPVVRGIGGLADTVTNDETGFVFQRPTLGELSKTLTEALRVFQDKERWRQYQLAGMQQDFSWTNSALQYFEMYRALLEKKVA